MFHLREPYVVALASPATPAALGRRRAASVRVGDAFLDSLTESVPDFVEPDLIAGSTVLDEWSATVEAEDSADEAAIDAELISEDAKTTRKKATTKKVSPPAPTSAAAASLLKQIQASLITLGYDLGPTGADGKIGPYTRGAITKFKVDHKISPADATINDPFRKALAAAVTEKKTGAPPAGASIAGSGTTITVVLLVVAAVAAGVYFFVK
jgi:hypothetical protein